MTLTTSALSLQQASFTSPITHCLCCGHNMLEPVLDLGSHYLTDFLDAPDSGHPKAPLSLMRCPDCYMLQLAHAVSRDKLFRQYHYKSGVNDSVRKHLASLIDDIHNHV